jgi:hypothetical protein
LIDGLPDNLYDYDRDTFGLGNPLLTCELDVEFGVTPDGSLTAHVER